MSSELSFKGYMRLYLNADTRDEMLAKSTFTGHWATRNWKIMRKPRRYHVNLYMQVQDGEQLHIKYVTPSKLDRFGLWESMKVAIDILLDVDNKHYIADLTEAFIELMGDTPKTHEIIQREIDKLPQSDIVIDMDGTYATIRC